MEIEEYGLAKVLKPHVDDAELRQVESLDGDGSLTDFDYTDKAVRHLAVEEQTLLGGRMTKIEAERVTFDQVSLQSVLIENCVLSSSDWMDCALSRVVFRNSKILGANFVENKWASVVFQNCRIEFATFDSVQASAPVVFVDTRFKDVTFRRSEFPGGHMARCTLDNVEFDGGTYTDFDFRGNDLSTIRGAGYLNGILIEPVQRQEIAEALVSELDLRYPDRDDQ
ncbi:MAG TPA: pentapeptide repeat-containing protein [Kribbella sp.]|uniref:pentapeptide repeat-containing protein n=1 Tax=Kribbella sp. TaxID=1871183 RepID=UPI002D78A4C3|nr:pentapeptide repeat-containing protein [Kribbella sp.]HET6298201.1 pentapeptide repeat-containing protein [Kribbella sp.]